MANHENEFRTRKPDFFIVGAPKCGTSALASWLGEHDEIFMCSPKEPEFFSSDIASFRSADTWDEYIGLFKLADRTHAAVGEASTAYLRSEVAVPQITKVIPNARFIVCLRNPVDMVHSVHAQLVRSGRETEPDVERAWDLQTSRSGGVNIPATVIEPKDLQYSEVCRLGDQVNRLLRIVDRNRVAFVFLSDLETNPKGEYERLVSWLGGRCDGREDFDRKNARTVPRNITLNVLAVRAKLLKHRLGIRRSLGLGRLLVKASNPSRSEGTGEVDDAFRWRLTEHFREDIELLGRLTDRDLSAWMERTRPAHTPPHG